MTSPDQQELTHAVDGSLARDCASPSARTGTTPSSAAGHATKEKAGRRSKRPGPLKKLGERIRRALSSSHDGKASTSSRATQTSPYPPMASEGVQAQAVPTESKGVQFAPERAAGADNAHGTTESGSHEDGAASGVKQIWCSAAELERIKEEGRRRPRPPFLSEAEWARAPDILRTSPGALAALYRRDPYTIVDADDAHHEGPTE